MGRCGGVRRERGGWEEWSRSCWNQSRGERKKEEMEWEEMGVERDGRMEWGEVGGGLG